MDSIIQMDFAILNWIQLHLTCPFMGFIMVWITRAADLGLLWIIPALIFLFFSKTRKMGIAMLIALLISFTLGSFVIKPIFERLRPYEVIQNFTLLISKPHGTSFPSLHTFTSFSAATAIMFFHKRFGVIALFIAALVAFSRMYLYVHFFTDVLVGTLLGIAIGWLSAALIRRIMKRSL